MTKNNEESVVILSDSEVSLILFHAIIIEKVSFQYTCIFENYE